MALNVEQLNSLFGVSESFHASYALAETLKSQADRERLFDSLVNTSPDMSVDWLRDYFQSEHSDRKGKGQDFTPDGIVAVVAGLLGTTTSNADICAGTGALTIKRWTENPDALFYCEEFSDRAIPFLLLNLAIRNMRAIVMHGDSLTRDFKACYELTPGAKYSDINETDDRPQVKADTVIMNPPYSLDWDPKPEYLLQPRFADYDALAPKSKADYAFLLQGLDALSDDGVMAIILPHGVLFRGAAEEKIRTALLERGEIETIIGMPGKCFMNTDIPTVILRLKKNRASSDVLFVDASNEFEKGKNQNTVEPEHVAKILSAVANRSDVERFAHVVTIEEVQENGYNLNIPRYVDTYEPEQVASFEELAKELTDIRQEIQESQKKLVDLMGGLVGTTPAADREIKMFAKVFAEQVGLPALKEQPQKKPKAKPQKIEDRQVSLFD